MNQLFNISRIDAVRAKEIEDAPDEPHVHDFEELIVGMEGKLEHFVDFKSEYSRSPPGQFHCKGESPPDNYKIAGWQFRHVGAAFQK